MLGTPWQVVFTLSNLIVFRTEQNLIYLVNSFIIHVHISRVGCIFTARFCCVHSRARTGPNLNPEQEPYNWIRLNIRIKIRISGFKTGSGPGLSRIQLDPAKPDPDPVPVQKTWSWIRSGSSNLYSVQCSGQNIGEPELNFEHSIN